MVVQIDAIARAAARDGRVRAVHYQRVLLLAVFTVEAGWLAALAFLAYWMVR